MPVWLTIPDLDMAFAPEDYSEATGIWSDSSGHGYDLTRAGVGPISVPNGTVALNSKPTVYVDGTGNQYFTAAAGVGDYTGLTGLTIFAVIEADLDITTAGPCVIGRDESGNRGWSMGMAPTTRRAQQIISKSSTTRAAREGDNIQPTGMPCVLRARYEGATGSMHVYVNGAIDSGALDSGPVPSSIAAAGPTLRVLNNGFDSRFKGHVGHILVFTRSLSDAECAAIENELIWTHHDLYVVRETDVSPSVATAHQGYATDGTNHWLSDTLSLRKRNSAWTSVAFNSSLFTGLPAGLDHIGDPDLYSGSLYVPAEDQTPPHVGHILLFNPDTLARTAAHDISAEAFEPSCLAVDAARNAIWIGSFQTAANILWRYNLTTFAFVGQVTLSRDIDTFQGLSLFTVDGELWASSGDLGADQNGMIWRINPDTGVVRAAYHAYFDPEVAEGIDVSQFDLRMLVAGSPDSVFFYNIGVTQAPNLRLDATTTSSATFSVAQDPLYIQVRYQRTSSTDRLFESPLATTTKSTADRYSHIETGLAASTGYLERAQVQYANGTWSDWTFYIGFTTVALPSYAGTGLPGGNIFTAPKHGQAVPGSGNTVTLTWFTGFGTPTLLEWSPLFTASWTTITSSGLGTGTYAWDVTAIATGTRVRVRLTIGGTLYEHPGFIIDKTGTQLTQYFAQMSSSFTGWSKFGATTNNTWAIGTFAQLVCSGFAGLRRASQTVWGQLHSPSNGAARLAYTSLTGGGYGVAHFVTITGAIFTGGGGFRWEYWYGAEQGQIGACIQFDDGSYIAAYFWNHQLGHPIGQCPGGDNLQGEFLITASNAGTGQGFNYSQTDLYAAGSTYPFTCSSTCYEREWDFHISLDWDKPSANQVRVRGRLGAPYDVVLEQTWTFSAPIGAGECGYPGIWSAHQNFSLAGVGNKWREIYNFGFVNTDTTCGVQPTPDEPPEAEPFPGEPCSVHLFTYEPDRTTLAWQVANVSPNVPTYLIDPSDSGSGYGEQEVDFIQGSASLGQVGVVVIDPKQIANDQDSGWMTERLSDAFDRTAIKGRRHRLLRYISVTEGWIVLADGDAGPPRLGDSFSDYEWEIRDTRERERKTKAFYRSSTTIMPRGGTDPWGTFNTQSDLGQQIGFAVDWPIYLTGRVVAGLAGIIGVDLRESHWTGNSCGIVCAVNPNTRAVMKGDGTISQGSVYPFPTRVVVQWLNLEIWWRLAGTLDDWTIVQPIIDVTGVDEVQTYLSLGAFPSVAVTLPTYTVAYGVYNEICQINEDANVAGDDHLWGATHIIMGTGPRTSQFLRYAKPRGTPTPALPTPTPNNLPTVGQQVEILVWYKGEPTEHLPYHYEGTVGDFLQRAYDGEFSEPDPITGATVPSGVRYDPAALALMTDPVLIRIGEKTDDLREFLEKRIYQPYGYAPALDNDGRVSPKHEALPTTGLSSLTLIDNDNTEAVPGWEHGDRIINRIIYTYHRYFNHPGKVREEGNVIKLEPSGDSIGKREVKFEYWDPESIDQFDEQKIEIDATAASTTGQFTGEPWFEIALEPGAIYADRRYQNISRRYSYGSPVVTVKCFRTGPRGTSHLRAGDWCRIDLSWMPDYLTRRRGTQRYGQIVAIRDLDCAWREITFELVQYLGATGGAVLGAVATGGTAVATATTSAVLGAVASTMTVTAAHSYSGMVAVAGAVAEGSAHIYTSSAVAGAAATGGDETVGAGPLDGGWGFEPFGDVFGEGS